MNRVGLIGDFDPDKAAHVAIPRAIQLASSELGYSFAYEWVATPELDRNVEEKLGKYEALWAVPGSPYVSTQGALNGIRYAREHQVPVLGSCGGFQHMMLEYGRNVLGLVGADHAEINPTATSLLVAPLTCSVSEQNHTFKLTPGSKVAGIYESSEIVEQYGICNYGLNPDFYPLFEQAGLRATGVDTEGATRIMELENHPFFVGTLFQPERSAFKQIVHPLIKAWLKAAV